MALIVITLQDGDEGVSIGVQMEPQAPRVVSVSNASRPPHTPAQQMAEQMLQVANAMLQPAPSGIVKLN